MQDEVLSPSSHRKGRKREPGVPDEIFAPFELSGGTWNSLVCFSVRGSRRVLKKPDAHARAAASLVRRPPEQRAVVRYGGEKVLTRGGAPHREGYPGSWEAAGCRTLLHKGPSCLAVTFPWKMAAGNSGATQYSVEILCGCGFILREGVRRFWALARAVGPPQAASRIWWWPANTDFLSRRKAHELS